MSHQRKRSVIAVGAATVPGLHPRVLCWVRTGSRDWRDRWHRLCRALGIHCDAVQEHGTDAGPAWVTVYDCWGAPCALESLTCGEHPVVVRSEYATTPCRVLQGSGSGERTAQAPLLPSERYNRG